MAPRFPHPRLIPFPPPPLSLLPSSSHCQPLAVALTSSPSLALSQLHAHLATPTPPALLLLPADDLPTFQTQQQTIVANEIGTIEDGTSDGGPSTVGEGGATLTVDGQSSLVALARQLHAQPISSSLHVLLPNRCTATTLTLAAYAGTVVGTPCVSLSLPELQHGLPLQGGTAHLCSASGPLGAAARLAALAGVSLTGTDLATLGATTALVRRTALPQLVDSLCQPLGLVEAGRVTDLLRPFATDPSSVAPSLFAAPLSPAAEYLLSLFHPQCHTDILESLSAPLPASLTLSAAERRSLSLSLSILHDRVSRLSPLARSLALNTSLASTNLSLPSILSLELSLSLSLPSSSSWSDLSRFVPDSWDFKTVESIPKGMVEEEVEKAVASVQQEGEVTSGGMERGAVEAREVARRAEQEAEEVRQLAKLVEEDPAQSWRNVDGTGAHYHDLPSGRQLPLADRS